MLCLKLFVTSPTRYFLINLLVLLPLFNSWGLFNSLLISIIIRLYLKIISHLWVEALYSWKLLSYLSQAVKMVKRQVQRYLFLSWTSSVWKELPSFLLIDLCSEIRPLLILLSAQLYHLSDVNFGHHSMPPPILPRVIFHDTWFMLPYIFLMELLSRKVGIGKRRLILWWWFD